MSLFEDTPLRALADLVPSGDYKPFNLDRSLPPSMGGYRPNPIYVSPDNYRALQRAMNTYPFNKSYRRDARWVDLRILGEQLNKASQPAIMCENRLKEQVYAGGVDCDYSRDTIRQRVYGELCALQAWRKHMSQLHKLGPHYCETWRDDPEARGDHDD